MNEIVNVLTDAAQAAGISSQLLLAVCFYESSFRNVVRPHDGRHTSTGICQIQLPAAHDVDPDLRALDLMNIEINAYVAATYLKQQLDNFEGRTWCAVDAYNKGAGNVECPKIDKHYHSKYTNKVRQIMKTQPWNRLSKPGKV